MNFTDIEKALIRELSRKVSSLKRVEGYAGQLEKDMEQMPLRLPAAYVVYEGSKFQEVDGLNAHESAVFSVMVAARALDPSDAEARESGIYAHLRDVLGALAHSDLGLGIERLRPLGITLVRGGIGAGGLLVYGIKVRAEFDSEYGR